MLDCGGCQDIYDSEAMAKKVKRLVNEGIFTVALTGCVKPECPCWSRIVSDLTAEGIEILTTAHE